MKRNLVPQIRNFSPTLIVVGRCRRCQFVVCMTIKSYGAPKGLIFLSLSPRLKLFLVSQHKYSGTHLFGLINMGSLVGDRKRNFVFLPKAERKASKKIPFWRNTESTERWSFCRKRLSLPKEGLSAKNLGQS